jgi:hypothetical protein
MKEFFILSLFFTASLTAIAQKKQFANGYLCGHVTEMVYDLFKKYTFTGFGAGAQIHFNTKHRLKPQIDVAGSLFGTNKILLVFADGTTTGPKQFVATIFAGLVYEPAKRLETGLSAGPAFHDDGTSIGIKPYIAYYLGKKKVIKAYTSLTHIFKPYSFSEKNTGIISAGLAVKLF